MQIKNQQQVYNNKIDEFLIFIKNKLKKIVEYNDDDSNLCMLLRYYLHMLVWANQDNIDTKYFIDHLPNEIYIHDESLYNPFQEKISQLKEDMKSKGNEVIEKIEKLKDRVNEINQSLLSFQQSLSYVIDTSEIELKGSCSMERPSTTIRIKSFFHIH